MKNHSSPALLLQNSKRRIMNHLLHRSRSLMTFTQKTKNAFSTTYSLKFPPLMRKVCIPESDLKITFSSSSGPGGQNVNKLATKVDVR